MPAMGAQRRQIKKASDSLNQMPFFVGLFLDQNAFLQFQDFF